MDNDRVNELRAAYKTYSLQDLSILMSKLRQEKDEKEAELKLINEEFDLLRFEMIPGQMEAEGVERVRYEGIGTVYLRSGIRASINSTNKEEAYQWLSDNGHGDLIRPTVNAQSLAAAINKMVADGENVPVDLINVFPYTQAVITK